jgi:hypothetical protein
MIQHFGCETSREEAATQSTKQYEYSHYFTAFFSCCKPSCTYTENFYFILQLMKWLRFILYPSYLKVLTSSTGVSFITILDLTGDLPMNARTFDL